MSLATTRRDGAERVNMKAEHTARRISTSVGFVTLLLLAGCGTGPSSTYSTPSTSGAPGPLAIQVTVNPSVVGVQRGSMSNFNASVSNSTNQTVTWSIQEGSAGGAINNAGVYSASSVDGVYHIVATSQADLSKSAVASVTVVKSGFTSAGNMSFARLQHTATLLPNGKVLIAGGGNGPDLIDGYFVVEQAEQFDPATAQFSPAGILSRDGPTATLLADGDVLFTGGETGWTNDFPIVSNTADLLRQATGLFEPTGSMAIGRESHAATLLGDGRVLVTGGLVPSGISWIAISEAEVYDPASGTFAAVGNMNAARASHTSIQLPNGKVLITAGGYIHGVNSAELFDPATGAFTPTGQMTTARTYATATLLLNGKVLITGGGNAAAELYDPVTGTFAPTGIMAANRIWHTATLLPDGTVLIAGGYSAGGETATTEIYDPATSSFTLGPSMRQGRFSHTATLLPDGSVLFAGGASGSLVINVLSSAEIYH